MASIYLLLCGYQKKKVYTQVFYIAQNCTWPLRRRHQKNHIIWCNKFNSKFLLILLVKRKNGISATTSHIAVWNLSVACHKNLVFPWAKNELQNLVASWASFLEFLVAHPNMKKPSISSSLKWKTWISAPWLLTEH